ncbi:hypothetical protein ACFL1Z_05695 [Thermodesulfobacteriota bacterium]
MKKIVIISTMAFILSIFGNTAIGGDLDFLRDIDRKARADVMEFTKQMSVSFGLSLPQVEVIIKSVPNPSDAFMIIRIGKLSNHSPEDVLRVFNYNTGQGWGNIAKHMGIKPGSREFHELKQAPSSLSLASKSAGKGKSKKNRKK